MSKQKSKEKRSLLVPLIIFRILNSLLTRSFFQADEFWQSLEPAHYKAFGYGELTWEWREGLRSYAFPLLFEIAYHVVKLMTRLSAWIVEGNVELFTMFVKWVFPNSALAWEMVFEMQKFPVELNEFIDYYGTIFAPKILMSLFAAIGEYYLIKFIRKIYLLTLTDKEDKRSLDTTSVVQISAVLTLTNFFNCFLITRPFINSFEMILTTIALYFWDWTGGDMISSSDFTYSLSLAFFTSLQRPTNAFLWIILGSFLSLSLLSKRAYCKLAYLFSKLIITFVGTFTANMAIDYYFYGEIVFPVFKFVQFNFTTSLSKFYGQAPWHFHLIQSLPIILGYNIPFFIHGFFSRTTTKRFSPFFTDPFFQFRIVIIISVLIYSLISHKEFRFIYSLQPFFILFSTVSLLRLRGSSLSRLKWIIWGVPCLSMIASFLLCTLHETGVVEVIHFLHDIPDIQSLGFVMPCHSTPWQSHLHRDNIPDLWYITCEPPLHLMNDPEANSKLAAYMDESDYLYDDIPKFIYQHFPPVFRKNLRTPEKAYRHEWPEFLVIFEQLDTEYMKEFLQDSGYIEFKRFFNTLQHWDPRRSGDVIVYYKPIFY